MSDTVDPPRLIDDPESGLLRDALASARSDVPDASAVEAMLARFPAGPGGGPSGPAHPPGGPSGPPPPIAGMPTATGAAAKIVAALFVTGSLAAGAYYGTRSSEPAPTVSATTASRSAPTVTASTDRAPSVVVSATAAPTTPASSGAPGPALPRPSASAADTDTRTEMDFLREAQASLGSSPEHAIALTNEAQKRFPRGALGQERDMIRIQALLGEGHAEEARALANDFKKRHPDSAHVSRLDELFP